jgi:hypothetical protein
LQRRATGWAAFAFAVRADVGGVWHQLPAVRAWLEFFFERQTAVWAFCINCSYLMSTFRAGQRPRFSAGQAHRRTSGHRLMAVGAKFLTAVITDIGSME